MAPDVHSTPSSQQDVPLRRRILLCYDGSAEAKHALERVGEVASVVPSQVTVVSVAEPIYEQPLYAGFADPARRRAIAGCSRNRRRNCVAAEWTRRRTSRSVSQPWPSSPPHATAPTSVVVGSRQRGLIKRLLFGSVSAQLVVEAPCDVLVVR